MKIGPVVLAENRLTYGTCVVSAENILIEIALRVHVMVRCISSNMSTFTGPIFANFSPYESSLRADDGSIPYFSMMETK